MKKYAVIVTSLVMFGSALQTPGFAQTGAGSSSSSGPSGAGSSQSDVGSPGGLQSGGTSGSSSSQSGQSSSILSGSRSSQPGSAINDPSGAQSGQQQQLGVITIHGSVSSETEKQAIETQLKQLPGVTSVKNMLRVASQGSISDPSGAQGGTNSGTSSGATNSSPDSGSSTP